MIRFPVEAAVRSDAGDQPKPAAPQNWVCIFDRMGYWARLGGAVFETPGDNLELAHNVARMINAAYEQGREDQAGAIRDAINYGEEAP